jgi:hypothetical protein
MEHLKPKRLTGVVKKGWGYELIWATNDSYAGKILVFERAGSKMSMHFHKEKDETWFVNSGKFKLRYIDTATATVYEKELAEGETWRNLPLMPHQLEALVDNSSITEVSTPDSIDDNYRIAPGDSQITNILDNEQQD